MLRRVTPDAAGLPRCRNLIVAARREGARAAGAAHARRAEEFNGFIAPGVRELRACSLSLRAIADQLNADGHATRRGKAWTHVQVLNILKGRGE